MRNRSAVRADNSQTAGDTVTINYPDTVSLAAFVDYVSQSLNVKIIYGDEVKNQSLVFRPGEVQVPTSHLLDLLRSMLRMQDLALIEGDVPGWLRIVQTSEMQRHVPEIRTVPPDHSTEANRVSTQVVRIASSELATISKHARQFLSSSKASVIEVPEKGLLIITDYEAAIAKAVEVIRLLDGEPKEVEVAAITPRHASAKTLAEQASKVLAEKSKLEGRPSIQATLHPAANSDGLLLIGTREACASVRALLEQLDTPESSSRIPVAYTPQYMSAARLAKLIQGTLGGTGGALNRAEASILVDEDTNRLYVTAAPEFHEQMRRLVEVEDVKTGEPSRPLRIYRPKNRQARELIGALSQILPEVTTTVTRADETVEGGKRTDAEPTIPPGPNRPPAAQEPGTPPPMPPAQEPIESAVVRRSGTTRIAGKDFTLTHDDHTNAILAVGPREFHAKLELLLTELDVRQPQVLIEMTLVAITFNDSLSLAVELTNEGWYGDYQSLLFSSFGLSDIDLSTGARTLHPGGGVNGVVVGPNETPFLFRAIAAHGNSRIVATPKVVVADNTTATIGSVEESPFTSINASDTVATTSFAGYESAGTTLTVTPHIAQGDHLKLDYSLSFSNFTGSGSVGVPPPRTNNTFTGTVEIPDAHLIIVGGLVTENEADSVTEVPLLGRIPVIGAFFQSSDRARIKSRIFAFIRPTILRDDQFADLKMFSASERERASLADTDYPGSEHLWMR